MDTARSFWQQKRRDEDGSNIPLQALQRRYRAALSGAVVAKARYLAQVGEAFATAITIERARWRWQRIEACRARLAAEISKLKLNADSMQHYPQQRELRV